MAFDFAEAGYKLWGSDTGQAGNDPFEDFVGPFYLRKESDGSYTTATALETRHMNMGGSVHGGLLMSFADFSLFAFAYDLFGQDVYGVTVSMTSNFIGPASTGDLLTGKGEVTRETGSMVFVKGELSANDAPVLSFSGIIKKMRHSQ